MSLDTTGHLVINQDAPYTSAAIKHNAYATVAESGGDGTSVQEVLERMPNVGSVDVARSDVDAATGGYTWTVTFLYDADNAGGQFGGCEQKDDATGRCNAPGDVPKLASASTASLLGDCGGFPTGEGSYNCTQVTVLDASSTAATGGATPPGHTEVVEYYVRDPAYIGFDDANYAYRLTYAGVPTDCLAWDADAADVTAALKTIDAAALDDVWVEKAYSETLAPGGVVYRVSFRGAGDAVSYTHLTLPTKA